MRTIIPLTLLFILLTQRPAQAQPQLNWELPTRPHLPQAVLCNSQQTHLFAALKTGGVAVLKLNNQQPPTQIATIPVDELGTLDAMNLCLVGDRLFVALGDFFRKECKAGLAMIDVSRVSRPRVLSVWRSSLPLKGAATVVANEKHAFVGAMSAGVMVFDVSNATNIQHLTTFQSDIHFPRRNPGRVQHPNARGLALVQNTLYVANDAGGLRVLDVSRPRQPREIGRYINAAMQNKQQAYNNLIVDGNRAYIAIDYAGLEIVDVSNPARIQQVGWWNPWQADTPQNFWLNSAGHVNQIAFDRRRKQVFLSAGDSELLVVDVKNPQQPRLHSQYGKPKNGLGVWGLALGQREVWLTYIQTVIPFRGTWSGIKSVTLK